VRTDLGSDLTTESTEKAQKHTEKKEKKREWTCPDTNFTKNPKRRERSQIFLIAFW